MNRKQKRAMQKSTGKDATQQLANKVAQFNKLPEFCLTCNKEFDKKDKEMINTWNVVVKQDTVRLFCPECVDKAKEAIDVSY
tara:strand:+ start:1322 stop:1567 length:246 start_codon:yes stop_codon:yes gene_type:complete